MQEVKRCKCGSVYIVNKKYSLCNDCNHLRLHGETVIETSIKRQEVYKHNSEKKLQQTVKKPVKIYYIPQSTTKKAQVNQKLSEVKKKIEMEAIQNGTYYCKGCGKGVACDKSHILSIKQHPELELEEENIDLLCRKCHETWESGDIEKIVTLLCFQRYLDYIYRHDTKKYTELNYKLQKWQSEQLRT